MRFLALIIVFFSSLIVSAQEPLYTHSRQFKVEDGLPQSFVSGLVQDQDGFLWIGTRDGLARYDGREFRTFRHKNDDTVTIASNVIIDLYLDPQNLLWITYVNNKIDCFNPRSLRLSKENRFPELQDLLKKYKVGKFFRDHMGVFWLNTNYEGIISFDPVSKRVSFFNATNKSLESSMNLGAAEIHPQQVAVFTDLGLHIIYGDKIKRDEFFPFGAALNFRAIPGTFYRTEILSTGKLVLSDKGRLIVFDLASKTWSSVGIPGPAASQSIIPFIQASTDGLLYFTAAGKIFRMEKNLSVTTLWRGSNSNRFGNDVKAFLKDSSGVIWYGTNGAGLYKIDLTTIPFYNSNYSKNFVVDNLTALPGLSLDQLPVSYKKGTWAYNFRYCYGKTGLFFTYAESQDTIGAGDIYLYQNNSLSRIPKKNSNLPVKGLCMSASGVLIASDRLGNIFKWKDIHEEPQTIPSALRLNIQTGDIADMEADDTIVWITVERDGFYKIKGEHVLAHYYSDPADKRALPTNQLTDISKDPFDKNILWIGTLGQGLIKWNKETGLEKIYTVDDGLPNNTIYGIVLDGQNNFWVSTNKGICRFNEKSNTYYNFDLGDGLISNEFNRFHYFRYPDGRISLGAFEGYSVFDPTKFTPDSFPTPIAFTRLFINNKEAGLTTLGLNGLTKLELPYNKNFLSFEFAGLQLNQPAKLHYRYMLKGYDKNWIEAGDRNLATYTRLPAGQYTLLINASNTAGNWSPIIRQLQIKIKPPFWATWWAYTLYALIVAALIRIYWTYRLNRVRMQNEILLEQSKARHLKEVDEIKNRFFDNITHEFRTPLTLILTPLEKLGKDESMSIAHRHILKNAHSSAVQLLRLINQLLDISKIESGQMKVNLSAGEFDDFVERCVGAFALEAKEKQIDLSFQNQGVSGHFNFDEEKWEKIIFNLVSNAIKFTPPGGRIIVSLRHKPDSQEIELGVADTGPGISKQNLSKIFDRFFMADDSVTRTRGGTGIGLSLARELTQLMKGRLHVESEPGLGAEFFVSVPLEKTEASITRQLISQQAAASGKPELVGEKSDELPILMVVEDNDELRSFMVETLSLNWRVLESSNGKHAWELILRELPEIVISDVMMPEMDGMELCRLAKNDNRTAHMSFILLTAKAAHQSKLEGLGVGADEYVTKPFHFDELELRIRNLIRHQEKLREHLQRQILPEKPLPKVPHVNDIFIEKLYRELDNRIDEPNMDVEGLAGLMNMSRRTLNRKLKTLLNISANDLIRRYRLQKAAELLASGHGVTHTAYTVGFETPSYFTQCFKEQYGQTPSEFANQKTA